MELLANSFNAKPFPIPKSLVDVSQPVNIPRIIPRTASFPGYLSFFQCPTFWSFCHHLVERQDLMRKTHKRIVKEQVARYPHQARQFALSNLIVLQF